MVDLPFQALRAASRPEASTAHACADEMRLVVAGATGALGNEALRRLVGSGRFAATRVLAREPITAGLRGVMAHVVEASTPPADWPPLALVDTAVVLFDPPRMFHDRERALWTPTPAELPALAAWLHASGVRTLAVVQPHAPGRLPEALKRGLASLDEQAVAALGFERLIFIRSADKPRAVAAGPGAARRLARWMLSALRFMVPSSEQPVRATKVVELLSVALRLAPPGIHIATPQLVWQAAQAGGVEAVARAWLLPRQSPAQ